MTITEENSEATRLLVKAEMRCRRLRTEFNSMAEWLGLTNRHTAKILCVTEDRATLIHKEKVDFDVNKREYGYAVEFVRACKTLETVLSKKPEWHAQASDWLRAENAHLQATPLSMLTTSNMATRRKFLGLLKDASDLGFPFRAPTFSRAV